MNNINTLGVQHLAIGAMHSMVVNGFTVVAKRVDDTTWMFDLMTRDMQESGNFSQVYSRDGQTFTVHADYDNGESFTSRREIHGAHAAIVDALIILTIG